MNTSELIKQELTHWIENYWATYLKGDLDNWGTLLHEEYRNIGGTKEEIWNSKQEILDYTYSMMHQMLGAVEFRNRVVDVIPYGEYVMLHEFTDIYIKSDEDWMFYGPFRMSSLLEKSGDSWMVLHQHGSYPDMKAMEGEAFSLDALKAENIRLKEAVKNRTIELEIEAALERVRSVATGMRKQQDLMDICQVIYNELQALGVGEIRNAMINVYDEDTPYFLNYDFAPATGKTVTAIPYNLHPLIEKQVLETKNIEDAFNEFSFSGIELIDFRALRKRNGEMDDPKLDKTSSLHYYFYSIGSGSIGISTYQAITAEKLEILKRFRNVFAFAYRRYMDVSQAESQAREAQVQLALERVRAAAMAMRSSTELGNLINHLYGELTKLDAKLDRCFIMIVNPENLSITWWLAGKEGLLAENGFAIPNNPHPSHQLYLRHWRDRAKKWTYLFEGKEKADWDHFGFTETELSKLPEFIKIDMAAVKRIHLSGSSDQFGLLVTGSIEPLRDEHQDILSRFTAVFNQTYTRFLDLQKAEAQAREAQIEAALERVRSRSMAMHKSDELLEAGEILFSEMQKLGIESLTAGFVLMDKEEKNGLNYTPDPSTKKIMSLPVIIPHNETNHLQRVVENWKKGTSHFVIEMDEEETIKHQTFIAERSTNFTLNAKQLIAISPARLFLHNFYFKEGYLLIVGGTRLSAEQIDIMLRFAKVFQQTYTRFLDLQKAEAQAREAQIQLALERVRARTMAMQSSEELAEVSYLLNKQVVDLGIPTRGCAFNIYNEHDSTEWFSNLEGTIPTYKTPRENIFLKYYEAGQRGETLWIEEFGGDRIKEHYKYLATLSVSGNEEKTIESNLEKVPEYQIDHVAYFKYGYLLFITLVPAPEAHDVFKRFAKEFEQTYTRFLDLQKAEAQAREAQIEAALERVRARTMAMQKSEELPEAAALLFQQVQTLGVPPWSCGFNIWEQGDTYFTSYMGSPQGTILDGFKIPLAEEATFIHFQESRDRGDKLFVDVLEGDTLEEHYRYLFTLPGIKEAFEKRAQVGEQRPTFQINHLANFSHGNLMFITYEPCPESHDIFIRFAKVFEQTYTRFLDLQKAEAQAREAQIEAALEKVRSRSLAMQKSGELTEVAELLRKEMGKLGVEELETSSIYIVDKENQQAECWYAIKDIREKNKRLVSDEITITFGDTWVGTEMKKFYQAKKQQASIIMKGKNRKEWINYCAGKSNVLQGYYGDEIPERTYHLVKFNGGYMGAASPGTISAESWDLLRRAATVFSLAYTRFNDLQVAEAHARQAEQDLIAIKEAKQKAEAALHELKATQAQLVQQEKLASLGQLTAGIAHEIKNPLNFVNNFSEVSLELIDEALEEMAKIEANKHAGETVGILSDVKSNLTKIHEHGTRANNIVSSMLQHSRGSSGKKEASDFNTLVKEYVNLCFHGMRAGKNPINVSIAMDMDPHIGEVPLVVEDFTRVVVNLCNNAFDAMRAKLLNDKTGNFMPQLIVKTQKNDHSITLSICDNGPGIPDAIKDKILQPFFTTKKGTEGTGLGLSITHDIIKAHGGELKVESVEGEGSKFVIVLPT